MHMLLIDGIHSFQPILKWKIVLFQFTIADEPYVTIACWQFSSYEWVVMDKCTKTIKTRVGYECVWSSNHFFLDRIEILLIAKEMWKISFNLRIEEKHIQIKDKILYSGFSSLIASRICARTASGNFPWAFFSHCFECALFHTHIFE